jgi:hypothetical protein
VRAAIAILLLVAVTPIVPEVVEAGVHVVLHGDLPHHEDSGDGHQGQDPRGTDEHGCTPLFHSCSCHLPMSAAPAWAAASVTVILDGSTDARVHSTLAGGRVGEPPPIRPPIS